MKSSYPDGLAGSISRVLMPLEEVPASSSQIFGLFGKKIWIERLGRVGIISEIVNRLEAVRRSMM